jgi:class 3 adenylate cyclase
MPDLSAGGTADVRERRFIEWFARIDQWPMAKRTLLLTNLIFVAHGVVCVVVAALAEGSPGIDRSALNVVLLGSLVAIAVPLIQSLLCVVLGREGRSTPYSLVLFYGTWVTWFVYSLGSWSTPFFVFYPMAVVLVALFYGERVGWWTFAFGLVCLLVRQALEFTTDIRYAPLLKDRSIDAQTDPSWVAINSLVCMALFVFCFVISILVVATRRLQDDRLREAYDRLALSSAQLVRANELISRYVPRQVTERIMAGEHSIEFNPERRKLTIFFSDVEGFTDSSDQMDPEALADFLNLYLATMSEIAEAHGATINQFVGDGIMSFFGAPVATEDRDHALRAVRMALRMQETMPTLNEAWIERGGRRAFQVRIGINTGYASVGDYGSPGRKTYSAIGVQTNLAARIESMCTPGRVLISDTTWALVRDQFHGEDKGEFTFKGLHYPVRVFEVRRAGSPAPVPAGLLQA